LWYKTLDLLVVGLSLSLYFLGFALGGIYSFRSSATLSRILGILLSAHAITAIGLAGFGYGYFALLFALPVGVTSGGLLSLPVAKVMTPTRTILLSSFPFIGALLMVYFGEDSPLVLSASIALIAAAILFGSLKAVVPKPAFTEKIRIGIPLKYAVFAIGTALGGTMGTALSSVIAAVYYEVSLVYIGAVIAASLVISQFLGGSLVSQNALQKTMGTTIGLSLFFVLFIMAITDSQIAFMVLWLVVLVDLSIYNTFVMAVVKTLKQCNELSFSIFSSIVSAFAPIFAILMWATGTFHVIFFFSAMLILVSIFTLRQILKTRGQ